VNNARIAEIHRRLAELHQEIADELDPPVAERDTKPPKKSRTRRRHRPQIEAPTDPAVLAEARRLMAGT